MIRFAAPLLLALIPLSSSATTVTVPISEIPELAGGTVGSPEEALRAYLAQLLLEELEELGLDPETGLFVREFEVPGLFEELADLCLIPLPKSVETDPTIATLVLDSGSSLDLNLAALTDITVGAQLAGTVSTVADAEVKWGQAIPFVGNCETIASDGGTIGVSVPFELSLTVELTLDLSYDEALTALVVDKHAAISGSLSLTGGNIDPEFGDLSITELLVDLFEDDLLEALTDNGLETFAEELAALNFRLDGRNADGEIDPDIEAFNGPSVFVLEQNAEDLELIRALLAELGLPEIVIALVEERGVEILLQLLVLDDAQRDAFLAELGVTIACDAVLGRYAQPLMRTPLYQLEGEQCSVADLDAESAGPYFVDDTCGVEVAFSPTSDAQFCAEQLDGSAQERLGNAAYWTPDPAQPNDVLPGVVSRRWTALPSTRLDLGVIGNGDNHQPYTKQLRYKTVEDTGRGDGTCALEMRIYKNDIAADALRPMLALHGGTWRNRGSAFLGLEATLTQFTQRGFVVFAPFYRLTGEADGNVECNGVGWRDVTEDAEDALEWVRENGEAFGALDAPVTLFGQSAGAHLAAWLAAYEPLDVDHALLMYPPLDFVDFLKEGLAVDSAFAEQADFALRALARFFGARGGDAEIRFGGIDPAELSVDTLLADPETILPDDAFDVSNMDVGDPSPYFEECANRTGNDLAALDLENLPQDMLTCMKRELAEFLAQNSFITTLGDPGIPLYVVHGSADSIVPYQQSVRLCAERAQRVHPEDIVDVLTLYECGPESEAAIVKDAEHALDLGVCLGPLCPAGALATPSRSASEQALGAAYEWVAQDFTPEAPEPPMENPPDPGEEQVPPEIATDEPPVVIDVGGRGAIGGFGIALLLLCIVRRRLFSRSLLPRIP